MTERAGTGRGAAHRASRWLLALLFAISCGCDSVAVAQPVGGTSSTVLDVVAAPPDDGYWGWLPLFVSEREALEGRVGQALAELSIVANHVTRLRGQWFELMRLDMELEGAALENLFADGTAQPGAQTFASLRGERDRIRTEIRDQRDVQRRIIDDAAAALRGVRTSLDAQRRRSGPQRRQWLGDEAEAFRELEGLLRLQLLAAAEWYEEPEFGRLLSQRMASGADPVATAQLEAERYRAEATRLRSVALIQALLPGATGGSGGAESQARTSLFGALTALRSALVRAPERPELRVQLLELEREFLRLIGAKLERERAVSLHGFHAYLQHRGFDPASDGGWWQPVRELVTTMGTLGPISTTWAQLWGVPDAQARATIADQERIAQDLVALAAMIRLNRRGVTVPEMRTIAPAVLADTLAPAAVDRRPLSLVQVRQIWRDIHEAFQDLGELRALADGDAQAFAVRLDAPYVDRIYADQSWGEFLGDGLSVRHLVTFWSGFAVAKVGGRWVGATRPARWAETLGTGEVLRTSPWLGKALRFDQLGQRLAATGAGARLRDALVTHRAVVAAQPQWLQAINSVGELGAGMILMGSASHLAAESGIPGLQLVVDALLEFNAADLLVDALVHAETPLVRLASRLDDWAAGLAREREALGRLTADISALERSLAAARGTPRAVAGQPGPPATSRATLRRDAQDGRTAAAESFAAARRALDTGDVAEAARALEASRRLTGRVEQQVVQAESRVQLARSRLASARRAVVTVPPGGVPRDLAVVAKANVEQFLDDRFYGVRVVGRSLEAGDDALRRGDLEGAVQHYTAAGRAGQRARGAAPDAELDALLEGRLALARGALVERDAIARLQASQAKLGADRALDDGEAAQALTAVLAGQGAPTPPPGWKELKAGKVWGVPGYVVKEVDESVAVTEAAASALARAVGLEAPAGRLQRGGDGRAYLVLRAVDAKEMYDLPLSALPALRRDYARQRAFRAWIGDADGHLRNQLLAPDGRLWQIDFDMASLRGTIQQQMGPLELATPADLIRATLGFVHRGEPLPAVSPSHQWLVPAVEKFLNVMSRSGGPAREVANYRWMAKLDALIDQGDMADVVREIQSLSGDRARLEALLRDAGIPDVDNVADALVERAGVLDQVLRERFLRGPQRASGTIDRAAPGRRVVFDWPEPLRAAA